MRDLIVHELRRRLGTIAGWAIGLGAFCSAYVLLYTALPPEVREIDVRALALLESLGMETFSTFDGFVLSTAFNFLPLLVGVLGVVLGIGALAAEESDGTLELLAVLPISRTRLLLGKAIAASLMLLVILVLAGAIVAGVFTALSIDTSVTAVDIFGVVASHWLIGFIFLTLGLFLGAYLPSREAASSTSALALVVSFFGDNLAGLDPTLEPLQPLLPHYHFEKIARMLTGPTAWREIALLAVVGLLALTLAALAFSRRNLTVGAWPWRRSRPPRRVRAEAPRPTAVDRSPLLIALAIATLLALGAVAVWSLVPGEAVPTPTNTLAPVAPIATSAPITSTPMPTASSTPAPEPLPSESPTATLTTEPTATATITPAPTATPVTHTVQAGDTLAQIAQDYGTTTEALLEVNDIADPARIEVGQVIVIPPVE